MLSMIGAVELSYAHSGPIIPTPVKPQRSQQQLGSIVLTVAGSILVPCHTFLVGSAAATVDIEILAIGAFLGIARVVIGEFSLNWPYISSET